MTPRTDFEALMLEKMDIANNSIKELRIEMNRNIELLEKKVDNNNEKLHNHQLDLARLDTAFKIKSGLWGLVGGAISALLAIIIKLTNHS